MKRISALRPTDPVGVCITALLFTISLIAPLQGCAALNPKELTRSRAHAILREHGMFKKPAVLPISEAEKFPVPAVSAVEPEPKDRALEQFFEDRPEMGVLRHLGLVEATATAVERPKVLPYTGRLTMWTFKITPRLTAKGKKAVSVAGGEGEDSVPALRREIIEVTGLKKEGEGRAEVEFTWKSVPTAAGEAFDPTSATFKTLPPQLQQKITHVNILGNSLKMEFGKVRKATAYFQLYDDGWRVDHIR